jgi:hypothetical protein
MRNRPLRLIPDFATVPRCARRRSSVSTRAATIFLERHIAGRHFLRLEDSGGYFGRCKRPRRQPQRPHYEARQFIAAEVPRAPIASWPVWVMTRSVCSCTLVHLPSTLTARSARRSSPVGAFGRIQGAGRQRRALTACFKARCDPINQGQATPAPCWNGTKRRQLRRFR